MMDDCKRPRTIALEYRGLQNSDNYGVPRLASLKVAIRNGIKYRPAR